MSRLLFGLRCNSRFQTYADVFGYFYLFIVSRDSRDVSPEQEAVGNNWNYCHVVFCLCLPVQLQHHVCLTGITLPVRISPPPPPDPVREILTIMRRTCRPEKTATRRRKPRGPVLLHAVGPTCLSADLKLFIRSTSHMAAS